ncbi:MAG: hypothetical protein V7K18_08855 [Nostoc sp.]
MGFLWILNGCSIYAVEIRWRDRSQLLPSLRSRQLVNGLVDSHFIFWHP